jgi:pimeloyl-ACP methyl ester carboxylesterase
MVRALAAAMLFVAVASGSAAATPVDFDAPYEHRGRLVDIGGRRLNLVCRGSGSPTVVFDAGLGDWSAAWSKVQPVIAETTRACSYDRAGYGWSDAGPLPRDSASIVSDLHALLGAASIGPPYILVGHSFGSYTMRLFADRYLDEVAGIVLVDGSHEDQLAAVVAQDPHAVADERAFVFTLRTCRALAFRGLPERTFSSALNAVLLRAALAPAAYETQLREEHGFATTSAAEVRRARRPLGSIPLRILTATQHFAHTSATTPDQRRRDAAFERAWQALQRSWLGLSTDARMTLALRSGHYVQLDQPALVIDAIRAELTIARRHPRASLCPAQARVDPANSGSEGAGFTFSQR